MFCDRWSSKVIVWYEDKYLEGEAIRRITKSVVQRLRHPFTMDLVVRNVASLFVMIVGKPMRLMRHVFFRCDKAARYTDSIASSVHWLWSMDTKDNYESMQCSSNLLICFLKNKPAADGNSSKWQLQYEKSN
jgi:hypothetical protein